MGQYTSIWNKIIGILGVKIKESEAAQHIAYLRGLTGYMQEWYPATRLDELLLAYQIGALGEYDIEMYATLTPVQIGKVMSAYKTFRQIELARNPAPLTDPGKLLAPPDPVPSPAQQAASAMALIQTAYQQVSQGGTYADWGNALYTWLDSVGGIPFDTARKIEFMRLAQLAEQRENERKKYTTAGYERQAVRSLDEQLTRAISENKLYEPLRVKIIDRAKQIAFNTLLKELSDQGVTIHEFLEALPLPGK